MTNRLIHLGLGLLVCASLTAGDDPNANPLDHWAFRAPERPAAPTVKHAAWVRNPIDAFIAAEHDRRGFVPAPPADKGTLLRRVHVDLVGLPPTRDELRAFLADESPDAYEKIVERLLASPQYGERWARHWMDVWRYSDWFGRRQVPDVWNSAPQVWRWRDWIVNSLNADKGYDRMVSEMLAADEIAPEDDDAAVATGYLIRNWYALNPNQWMRDNVEHVGKAFLGLTLACAHCHDHKYDPVTQEDYFRFRAFFEPIDVRQDRVAGQADCGPFQKYEYSVLRKVQQLGAVRILDERPDAKTIMYRGGDERSPIEGKPPVEPGVPAFFGASVKVEPVELPPAAFYPGLKRFIQDDEIARRRAAVLAVETALKDAKAALEKLPQPAADAAESEVKLAAARREAAQLGVRVAESKLTAARADLAGIEARVLADNARYRGDASPAASGTVDALVRAASTADREAAHALAQSAVIAAEKAVADAQLKLATTAASDQAAVAKANTELQTANTQLAAAKKAVGAAEAKLKEEPAAYTPLSPVYPAKSTGRRRALAGWIASRSNPLTARVAVNHIWTRHFGQPLVATVSDFGRNGKPPSHPELLDWLAVELMDHGWSQKHLHRLIVTSNAYRQGPISNLKSQISDFNSRDDGIAFLTGMPPRRMEAEIVRDSLLHLSGQLDSTLGGQPIENDQAEVSRRRSLYLSIYPEGGGHSQMLEIFDAPDPSDCYRRSESIVPQQALALTNGRVARNSSRLLARKLWTDLAPREPIPELRELVFVTAAFESVLSRRPTEIEHRACLDFLAQQEALFRMADSKQLATPVGEGAVAASTAPQLRACEDLVHALFSHNDFTTVR